MPTLFYCLKLFLLVSSLCLLGIGFVTAWDWFFWRRLPYVRWLANQMSPAEFSLLREITRVRRLKTPFEPRVRRPSACDDEGR